MVFLAFFIVIIIAAALTITRLRISFMLLVSIDKGGFHAEIRVMFYRLLTLFKWTLEEGGISFLLKKKKEVPDELKEKKGKLSSSFKMLFSKDTFEHLKRNMEIFDVSVKGWLATKDASRTALLYGWIWGILGALIPFIPQKRLILKFYPDFQKDTSDLHITCILRVRIIHIIDLIIHQNRKKTTKGSSESYGTASY